MYQLITKEAAARVVSLHPVHVMRLARAGMFPAPIKLGDSRNCAVRFVESEVEAWLQKKLAERHAPEPAPQAA